jgi:hypothetical protein
MFESSRNLSGYYQEYELEPQGQENRIWTRDHYKLHNASYFYDEERRTGMLDWNGEMFPVKCFIGCDPATDIKTFNSDDSAFVVVAYDANRRLFVLETVAELSIPQLALRDPDGKIIGKPGVVDILFDLYDRYHCDNATVEDVGMTRGVWQDIQAEQYRRNRYDVIVHPIEPMGQDKRDKLVAGLNSMFVQRLIHYRDDQYKLREQTEEMGPQLVHDDLIESLFFATRNLVLPNENSSILRKVGQRLHLNRNWKTL